MQTNEVTAKLPAHLRGLIIEQPYNSYTAQDHAVWRYVMRQNVRFLSKYAHGSYTEGLKKTGISTETIPHMYGMNRILKEIGWAAVAVDGFIPPSAFMEFQAFNVLVIAADIRPIDQIAYTPAPDIIHEAAGHAPIIADSEYAEYLRFFGEIGSKAFSSARDYELYEAIRHLSILKADPYTNAADIAKAEANLTFLEQNMGKPSEMARIRNLHWWTVEYGLIGDVDNFKIYGAGLLSSIGESMNCIKPKVKKILYDISAADFGFDITTQQPQLFVTPDFKHLNDVLNSFADQMALRKGGIDALRKAEESENTATIELSSGIQISGTFAGGIIDNEQVIYLKTTGPTSLCYKNSELDGHGKSWHSEGFGSPVGLLKDGANLWQLSEAELAEKGIAKGEPCKLTFESNIVVEGITEYILQKEGKTLLIGFSSCRVSRGDEILFRPEWGMFDMVVGDRVVSAYPGPADPVAFGYVFDAPAERTHKIEHTPEALKLHALYQAIRDIRESDSAQGIEETAIAAITSYPGEWLLLTEILEYLRNAWLYPETQAQISEALKALSEKDTEIAQLITDALSC
jgi:phenylalanine-4-hydroxylase